MNQGVRQAQTVPAPPQRDASGKPNARRIIVALVIGELPGGVQRPRRRLSRRAFPGIVVGLAALSEQRFEPGAALVKPAVEIPEPAKRARQSPAGFAARVVFRASCGCGGAQVFIFALQTVQPEPPFGARQMGRGLFGQIAKPIAVSLTHGGCRGFAAFGQPVLPVLPHGFQQLVASLPVFLRLVGDERLFDQRGKQIKNAPGFQRPNASVGVRRGGRSERMPAKTAFTRGGFDAFGAVGAAFFVGVHEATSSDHR